MPLNIACPYCKHANRIEDSQKGKEVRCAGCGKGFMVKVKAPTTAPVERSEPKGQVKAGPPKLSGRAAAEEEPRRAKVDLDNVEVVDEETRSRRRRRDEDEEEEERRPRRRQREESGSGLMIGLIIGGVVLLLGGGAALAWYFLAGGQNVPVAGPGAPVPPPPVINPARLHDVVLDPARPGDFDVMLMLLNHEEEALKRRAYDWLAKANSDHPRKGEVSKILENRIVQYHKGGAHENREFFDAYFGWATKDNHNWLMILVKDKELGQRDRRSKAMHTLARLKDERAIPVLVEMMGDFFDRDAAYKALAEMGPVAEKSVLAAYNHPERQTRDNAQRLLQVYKTSPDKLLTQTIEDLNSPEENRVTHALESLAKAPVDEKRRVEVSKALDPHIVSKFGRRDQLMTCLRRWATAENITKLSQWLDNEKLRGEEVIAILGTIRDPRAATALATRLGNFFDGKEAQSALEKLGPLAEPAVIPYLMSTTRGQPTAAANVLAVIGTPKSIPAITAAGKASKDGEFIKAAVTAINAINARGK